MTKWLKRIALFVFAVLIIGCVAGWWLLRGSLPVLDGDAALSGLSAPVSVARDALGTVTIDAASETDAMRALGYVHAQERYFGMDLMRRSAAGELAELFGPVALDTDKRLRAHRMRARVEANLESIAGERMPQLRAYADGVNAGLADLRVRPWPYLLLGQSPQPWTPADSALTGYAMYFDLQDADNTRELALWRLRPHLPPALFALLTRDGTRWDAPLMGRPRGDAVLPDAATVDLRRLPAPESSDTDTSTFSSLHTLKSIFSKPDHVQDADLAPGSNNFAVSDALTADGRAIVADDMHLGLRVPNVWFRARLRYPDPRAPGGRVDITGFTLPGLPAVVVGSNTHVAWGFTNSYVDTLDWRRVRPCTGAARGEDCDVVTTHAETIAVADDDPVTVEVEETGWGPILHQQADGTALALRWIAHLPGALNFGLADFAHAHDIDQALAIADRTAMPTQNLVIAGRDGRIAWRLLGPVALRDPGCGQGALVVDDARRAAAPSARCAPWSISTAASPALTSPPLDRLWTANARVVDGQALQRIGDGGYAFGARARQIREGLFAKRQFTERDLLAIQLDDRAVFLTQWWQLLREVATEADSPALHALADAARTWQGRASIDSVSYRIVRAWRLAVHARIADGLTGPAQAALDEDFIMPDLPQLEGVAWPLVQQRPAHLLPRRFACTSKPAARDARCDDANRWLALFEDAAVEVRDELAAQGPLHERTWGERNTAAICHPLAAAIPLIGTRILCMPAGPLPGDGNMPLVQGPDFGASQRMVVSPGHEADAIAHMPGGQSGHPLSPFWGAGHDDWAHGRPTPFLPGKTAYTLTLNP